MKQINKPKVSVIIPTYNDIKHVSIAIDSIINQTHKNTEIIVVDDASTDNTYQKLKKRYGSKIILIKQNVNKKLGVARNTGLNKATGEYVMFVDSDDWIEPETITEILKIADINNSDITAFGVNLVWNDRKQKYYHGHNLECEGGIQALKLFSEYKIGSIVTNKIYLRSFLNKNKLRFIKNYYHEDVSFTTKSVFLCKKYVSIDKPYYNYLQQDNSITGSVPTVLHLRSYIQLLLFIDKFTQDNLLTTKLDKGDVSSSLLKSHFLNDVLPKLVRYKKMKPDNWENDLLDATKQELKSNWISGYTLFKDATINFEKASDTSEIDNLSTIVKTKDKELTNLSTIVKTKDKELTNLSTIVKTKDKELTNLSTIVKTKDKELEKYIEIYKTICFERDNFENRLKKIYESKGWRFLRKIYIIRDYIFPKNSYIKQLFKENIFKINNLKICISNIYYRLKTKKNINLNSKKIVFVEHSYHLKTKSNDFILSYLKKHFNITEIADESWMGKKPFPDLSFIDKSYLGVIFWQNIPSPEVIKNINNENIIFFPMYDNVGGQNYEFWKNYINLKIINFSKTLHKKLVIWGFESYYIQYFPKPLPFIKNKTHKVFFWQRTNVIDINLVEKLLGNFKTKIHIHQAIDPNCTFTKPTKKQEKKFDISYSNWFNTREEMQKKIQECDIYIAPREYEGIGMSFLEAMSMGKAVIALNNPTMNEYITNNQTGYLFDKNNFKSIDFSKISDIRKNTYDYSKNKYQNWINQRGKLINIIFK